MNAPAYFEIQANDCKRAVDFYTAIFDWKCVLDDSLPIEYWRVETDGANGGILPRPKKEVSLEMGTNAYTNSMMVESFDETAKKILAHGGQVAMEKFAVPGKCWQGYFVDPEHNVFGIFEVDENAA